jgi:hypothetical protein
MVILQMREQERVAVSFMPGYVLGRCVLFFSYMLKGII